MHELGLKTLPIWDTAGAGGGLTHLATTAVKTGASWIQLLNQNICRVESKNLQLAVTQPTHCIQARRMGSPCEKCSLFLK